jgi:hypothetical protein
MNGNILNNLARLLGTLKPSKLLLAALFLLVMSQSKPAIATPLQQAANLLQNPGFDEPYDADGSAHGWQRWHNETGAESKDPECVSGYHYEPHWSVEFLTARFIHAGANSQHVGMQWDTWMAGVFQTVSVTPGATYRFSVYGHGRGASGPIPLASEQGLNMNMRVGIDPNGTNLWYDGDVVWSGTGSPHDRWEQFSVEATATGDQITVFTSANWGVPGVAQCRMFLDVWFDTAELIELAPPATATSPPPPPPPPATATPLPPTATPTPEFTPTATPVPTDTPTATPEPPKGGTICLNAFADDNGNGNHDSDEGYMAGVTFTVASRESVVGQALSLGNATPICFDGLPAGSYQVAQILPSRLTMTTLSNTMLEISEGKSYGVEFGSRIAQPVLETVPASPVAVADSGVESTPGAGTGEQAGGSSLDLEGESVDLLELSGLFVMFLGVVLLGALIFIMLRKQSR